MEPQLKRLGGGYLRPRQRRLEQGAPGAAAGAELRGPGKSPGRDGVCSHPTKGCGSGPATISTNREERTRGQKASGSAFLSRLFKRKGNLELLSWVLFPPHKRKRQLFVCIQSFPAIPAESLHFKAHCRDIPPLVHALKSLWRPSSKPCFLCSPERAPSQRQEPPLVPKTSPRRLAAAVRRGHGVCPSLERGQQENKTPQRLPS